VLQPGGFVALAALDWRTYRTSPGFAPRTIDFLIAKSRQKRQLRTLMSK